MKRPMGTKRRSFITGTKQRSFPTTTTSLGTDGIETAFVPYGTDVVVGHVRRNVPYVSPIINDGGIWIILPMLDQTFANGIVQNVMDGRFDGSVVPDDAVVTAVLP